MLRVYVLIDRSRKIVVDGQPGFIGSCDIFLYSNNEMFLDTSGYKVERLNHRRMVKGGLVLNISDELPYSIRSYFTRNEEGVFESQFVDIKLQNKDPIIVNVY